MKINTSNLPINWAVSRLGDITTLRRESIDPQEYPEKEFNYLSIGNIESETGSLVNFKPTLGKSIKSSKLVFKKGDILYSRLRPNLNKVLLPDFSGIGATDLIPLEVRHGIDRQYLGFYLRSQYAVDYATERLRGNQLPRIGTKEIMFLPVPIAPFTEQKRIVAKINAMLAKSRIIIDSLERTPRMIASFRQLVLDKAFKGELTQRNPDDVPAQGLIKSVIREAKKVKQTEQSDNARKSLADLPPLPENWTWAKIGDVFDVVSGGTPKRTKPEYWNGNVAWVTSGEVAFNEITRTRERISDAGLENSSARLCPPGTVLLALYGEGKTRGQAAILRITAATNQAVACILCPEEKSSSGYVYWWLYHRYAETRRMGTGAYQPNMYLHQVKAIPIPLAPLLEQRTIVKRITELFSPINILETESKNAQKKVEKLEKTILTKAFSGELLTHNSNDEPADILMKRIRSETTKMPQRKRERKKVQRSTKGPKERTKSILSVLKELGEASIEVILEASGKTIGNFWDELEEEINAGRIEETRKGKLVLLKVKS